MTTPSAQTKLVDRLRKAAKDFEACQEWHGNAIEGDCEPHSSCQDEMLEASKAAIDAADFIAALRSDPDASAVREASLPLIETAPKDRPFLALMHDGREPPNLFWEIIEWNNHGGGKGRWMNDFGSEYAEDAEARGWTRPLRWTPLPTLVSQPSVPERETPQEQMSGIMAQTPEGP